jgi:hypothetical protein
MIQFFIYVVGPDSGFPCKVGVAENVKKRLSGLQTGNWEKLYIYHTEEMNSKSDAYRTEKIIHKRLKEHNINGEWFNLLASDLIKQIVQIMDERFIAKPELKLTALQRSSLIYKRKRERRVLKYFV